MDLSQLANLGEFLGGLAVVVTLVYLATQVRQNTSAIRASSAQAFGDSINGLNLLIAGDLEQARVWRLASEDPGAMSD